MQASMAYAPRAGRLGRLLDRLPGRRSVLQAAAVLVCFAVAMYAGPIAASNQLKFLVLGLGGIGVAVASLYRIEWGVLVLFASTTVVRFSFSTGTSSPLVGSLVLVGLLVAIWVMRMLLEDRRLHLLPSPVNTPLLAFAAICILAYLWSSAVRDPMIDLWDNFAKVRIGALGTMVLSPMALLLVGNRFREERLLKIVVGMFVAVGSVGIVAIMAHRNLPLVNMRGLFPMWVVVLCLAQALFNEELKKEFRIGLGLIAFAWVFYSTFINTAWMSGWVPTLAAAGVVLLLHSRRLFTIVLLVSIVMVAANWNYLDNKIVGGAAQEGDFGRVDAWEVNWRVTKDHLLLGTGPAGYAAYYMSLFPLEATATHNNYVDILAETGLLGMATFVWFMAAMAVVGARAWRRVPRQGFAHALAAACIGGYAGTFLAMMLGDWFLPFAYTQGIGGFDYTVWGWLFFGALLGLSQMAGRPGVAVVAE